MTKITKAQKVRAGWYSVAVVDWKEVLGTGRDELALDIWKEGRAIFSTWDVTYRTGFERSERNCIACFHRLSDAKAFALAAAKAARAGEAMPSPEDFEEHSWSQFGAGHVWNDVILPLTAELAA